MPGKVFTTENAAEKGRIGGIKSGESRRRKKEMKDIVKIVMEMPLYDRPLEDYENLEDAKGKNIQVIEAVVNSLAAKAMKGDARCAELLFKLSNLMPDQKVEINAEVSERNGYLNDIRTQLIDYKKFLNDKKEDE